MAGATMNPVQLNRSVNTSTDESQSPSYVNFLSISATVDQLRAHVHGDNSNSNNDFCNLCLYLSRGIDYAVANNEIPDRASHLPQLIKQVCQWANDDTQLHAGIMVLMISLKGACRNGWFSEKDNGELHILRNEIAASFSSVRDMNSEESTLHHSISAVMSRFYPGMKMSEILAFVEAMPGFGAFVKDFFIPNNAKSSGDKIYLFVAQTDNTETSSCIISPQHANYLLNGKAVDRTCSCKDSGPQIPTLVTHMVKYGTNILQVMGQFKGKCVIVVAYMSMVSNPSFPALPDYVPPTAAASHSENDIIEGPSRISLNCPISFGRIKTPVKGYLCKHLQCFDFDNYVGINSRKPSWRCPHCSQSVCFTDIRIDQTMVKILEEVGVNAIHVKISADGSWETVDGGDVHTDKPEDKPTFHRESTTTLDAGAGIMDPMEGGNMDASNSHLENDRKPSPSQLQNVNLNNVHRSTASHMENLFQITNLWTHENWTSNTTPYVSMTEPENVISQGQSQPFAANSLQLPIHAIGSVNTRSNDTMTAPVTDTFVNANSQHQSQTCASNYMQSQQHNSNNVSNGCGGRYPTPARLVKRIPVAVQALPDQTSTGMVSGDKQQQFSMFHMDQHQIMRMIAASSSLSTGPQGWFRQDRSHFSSQPFQFGAHAGPPKKLNVYLHTTPRPLDDFDSRRHRSLNQMLPDSVLSAGQFSPQISQGVAGPTNGLASNQEAHHYMNAAAQQATQNMSWTPPVPAPLQTSVSAVPMASLEQHRGQAQAQAQRVMEVSANSPVVDPWQPTIRMRGGLSGQAHSDAMNQFMFNPIQPMQATRPPVLNTPRPVIPPHLKVLMDYSRNAPSYQYNASGPVLDGDSDGSRAGVLPYI